jgi:hypothetical protein
MGAFQYLPLVMGCPLFEAQNLFGLDGSGWSDQGDGIAGLKGLGFDHGWVVLIGLV